MKHQAYSAYRASATAVFSAIARNIKVNSVCISMLEAGFDHRLAVIQQHLLTVILITAYNNIIRMRPQKWKQLGRHSKIQLTTTQKQFLVNLKRT